MVNVNLVNVNMVNINMVNTVVNINMVRNMVNKSNLIGAFEHKNATLAPQRTTQNKVKTANR